MIDLSFLTEEEQEIIQEVLRRDAELKKAEEQRIQNLQQTMSDSSLRRSMTGEWFYHSKQLRHQDRIHSTDIIRASIRQMQRPPTLMELTQAFSETLPGVSGEGEGAPPVGCSLLQVLQGQHHSGSVKNQTHLPWEMSRDVPKAVLQSPPKQRKNPFNSEAEDRTYPQLNGALEESLTWCEGCTPAADLRGELPASADMRHACAPPPGVEDRPVSSSRDRPAEVGRPGSAENHTGSATVSSTDLPTHLEPHAPVVHASSGETQEDGGQVRSSSTDAPAGAAGWRDGEEAGEARVLDMERVAPAEEPEDGDLEDTIRLDPPGHSRSVLDKDGKDQELPERDDTGQHGLPHEVQGVSPTQEDSDSGVHVGTEEACPCQDGGAADVQPGSTVHQLPEHSKSRRLFHVSAGSELKLLGRFKDGNDPNPERPPQRGAYQEEAAAAAALELTVLPQTLFPQTATSADSQAVVSSHPPQMKTRVMTPAEAALGHSDPPQEDGSLELSGGDGVYRAKPIVIYETDDSLPESRTQDKVLVSASSPQALHQPSGEDNASRPQPVPAADGTSVGLSQQRAQEGLKHAAVPPTVPSTPSVESRGMAEGEGQTSLWKTNSLSRSLERSPLRSFGCAQDLSSPDHQVKTHTQERPPSPDKSGSPKPKRQKEEVRRSPSKTCHPRVLPREATSPQTPRLPGSPLKTFPIDIHPQTSDEHHGRPTPVPRQRRSPSHQAKQTALADPRDMSEVPSPSAALQPVKASEKSPPSLARSFIPQDSQHYLGPYEKAFVPSFHQEKRAFAESREPTEAVLSGVQLMAGNLNQAGDLEASGPVGSTLKWMSSSKSMENLISQSGEERNQNNSKEDLNKSVDEGSHQMKTSLSVPVLQLEETDSDSTLETNFIRRNTSSSVSNFSLSSGMNSMSSISSIGSIFPADVSDLEVQGSLQFAVNYIQKLGEFHVFVVSCRGLAVADVKRKRSDPYVKCYLLPDKSKLGKRKTSVKKKTSHPTFNEILRFKIPLEVLKTQNLNMSVWHNDTFGRNGFLGEVEVDMSEWDFGNTHINEYTLQARASAQPSPLLDRHLVDSRGQMRVAVRFLLQTSHSKRTSRMEMGEVQIWVKDCKNLPPVRGVTIDSFVKCTVLPDSSRKTRQKTRVVKRTASPMFNHTMVYDGFRTEDLREACVEITVWDHDRLHHHFIGGLRLGLGTGKSYGVDVAWMDSTSDEADLWQRMLRSDGEWVEDILPLRMLIMEKCK